MNTILQELTEKYPDLNGCREDIGKAFEAMKRSFENKGKLLLAGNGGSASDCEHVMGELMKGFVSKRPVPSSMREKLMKQEDEEGNYLADHLQGALPAISLVSQTSLMTAFANDVAADMIFAQQVYGYGQPGDVLAVFSTSGNSVNVVRAVQVAKTLGLVTIGFSGRDGGRLKELCDIAILVPYDRTHDIQERHLPVYHAICLMLEETFFSHENCTWRNRHRRNEMRGGSRF